MIARKPKKGVKAQYRQGDVFLIASSEKLGDKQPKENRVVLEYGEVTGHAHAIQETEKVDLFVEGSRRFLEVCFGMPDSTAHLVHEEHETIQLPSGIYEVRRQRTWSVLKQMQRVVTD